MDQNDFKLTEEQQRLVDEFVEAFRKIKRAGIAVILCQEQVESYITFINRNNAICFGNEDEMELYENERIDITSLVNDSSPWNASVDYTHSVWNNDRIYALPEGTELY